MLPDTALLQIYQREFLYVLITLRKSGLRQMQAIIQKDFHLLGVISHLKPCCYYMQKNYCTQTKV
jgi:hypothetical protein